MDDDDDDDADARASIDDAVLSVSKEDDADAAASVECRSFAAVAPVHVGLLDILTVFVVVVVVGGVTAVLAKEGSGFKPFVG